MHMSQADIDETDSTELDFIHGWLIEQKKREKEAMEGKTRGRQ